MRPMFLFGYIQKTICEFNSDRHAMLSLQQAPYSNGANNDELYKSNSLQAQASIITADPT